MRPLTEGNEILQPTDQFSAKTECGWTEWQTVHKHFIGNRVGSWCHSIAIGHIEFRRPVPDYSEAADGAPALPGSKYHRTITQTIGDDVGLEIVVDVYDVLRAFGVTNPAMQHAIKKLLCAGLRGSKSATQDLREAVVSIERAIELIGGNHNERN